MILKKEQFLWNFYKNGNAKISSCLERVSFKQQEIINKEPNQSSKLPKVFYLSLFPGFLDYKSVRNKDYASKKVMHYSFSGAGIDLDNAYSVESYLKNNNKKKLWTNIKRAKNKLEKAYAIEYEYNYGNISEDKCTFILQTLNKMISKRFADKSAQHSFMIDWENNILNMSDSIKQKKTSLFVIYANNKPISVSINRHISNTIFFCETHSFDLTYYKFGLGNLNNYMRLDWCFKNKIPFMDLGNGVSSLKKNWCNCFYEVYYLIFYKKNDPLAYILSYFEIFKIKLKNFIKSHIYDLHKKAILTNKSKS